MPGNQIYVGDLPQKTEKDYLESLFSKCGPIIETVLKTKQNKTTKFAFITFEDNESAENAIEKFNCTKIYGATIRVSICLNKETLSNLSNDEGNLIVKGIPIDVDVKDINETFSMYGEVLSCKMSNCKDEHFKYCYVQFKNTEDAREAHDNLQNAELHGKQITVEYYQNPNKNNTEDTYTNIYFKTKKNKMKLPIELQTEEGVKKFFSKYGEVTSVCVNNGYFGFANFAEHSNAVEAVKSLNGKKVFGVYLYVNRSMNKAEREKLHQKHVKRIIAATSGLIAVSLIAFMKFRKHKK